MIKSNVLSLLLRFMNNMLFGSLFSNGRLNNLLFLCIIKIGESYEFKANQEMVL